MNETTVEAPEQEMPKTMTAADRCDNCGAQAYVSVFFKEGGLLFCGHHYAKYEDKLKPITIGILDERERLLARADGAESH